MRMNAEIILLKCHRNRNKLLPDTERVMRCASVYEGKLSRTVLRRGEAGNRLVLSRRFYTRMSQLNTHTARWNKRIPFKHILNRIEHMTPVLLHCIYMPTSGTVDFSSETAMPLDSTA